MYRLDAVNENGEKTLKLFGHPNILYLPSKITGELLYKTVDRVVPISASYSIILTDGQVILLACFQKNINAGLDFSGMQKISIKQPLVKVFLSCINCSITLYCERPSFNLLVEFKIV